MRKGAICYAPFLVFKYNFVDLNVMKNETLYLIGVILFSIPTVWFVERLTFKIGAKIFKRHLKDIEEKEKKIQEYQYLTILALMSKEKEAASGFQDMASEIYWQIFFQKLVMFSSLFFLLLSPYMLIVHFLLKDKISFSFGLIFLTAISYFMIKTVFFYILNLINLRKNMKK